MKAITIRGVEPAVAEKLRLTAAKQNKSLNQLVLEFIKKNLGMEKEKNIRETMMILIVFSAAGMKRSLMPFKRRSARKGELIRISGYEKSID